MDEIVEVYSGYDYAVRPVAIHWQGARLAVAAVLDAWRDPRGKAFRIRTETDQIFNLLYVVENDSWEIQEIG
jgi:hypothetical protein